MGTEKFTTLDVYLAAFLAFHHIDPSLEDRHGKVVFVFPATGEVYRAMDRFNSNDPVPVGDFCTRVKTLRSKLLAMKEAR